MASGNLLLTFRNVQPFMLKKNDLQFTYIVKSVPITSENTSTDLGIIVSKDLTYYEHISEMFVKFEQRPFKTKRALTTVLLK